MSRYDDEIVALKDHFKGQLIAHEPFSMTEEAYQNGHDALSSGELKKLISEAFQMWLSERGYELSYNQVSLAFFQATNELGMITLVSRHPVFHLGSHVLIKRIDCENCRESLTNVPGHITSVRGDEHVVTIKASLYGERVGSRCLVINTDRLDEELCLIESTVHH